MLTSAGAKLLDFGLAKMTETAGAAAGSATSLPTVAQTLTAEGTILGTFQYMAPEQLEGKESDERSDIFSFGAMLYETITGRKAFQGSSQASLIAALMSTDPPPVSMAQPMASPALDRVVRKCLAKSPDDRWQSARDLLSELQWIAESGSQAGIPAAVAARRYGNQRLPGLLAAVALRHCCWRCWLRPRQHLRATVLRRWRFVSRFHRRIGWAFTGSICPRFRRTAGIVFTASATTSAPTSDIKLFIRPLNSSTAILLTLPVARFSLLVAGRAANHAFQNPTALLKIDVAGGLSHALRALALPLAGRGVAME